MAAGRPWLKFYPSDWRSDPKLRMCSLAARGLWMEMLALMHEAKPRGHLLVSGIAPTDAQLSVLAGCPTDQLPDLIGELESADVFSRTSKGVVYSRRMTRDEKKGRVAQTNGASGGNPSLCNESAYRPSDNPKDKGRDNAQRLEARCQKEKKDLRTKRSRVSYSEDFETFWKQYPADPNMSKKEAWQEWQRLDEQDRKDAAASLDAFNNWCRRQADYRVVHACRYLKYRRWEGHLRAAEEFREQKKQRQVKVLSGTPPYQAWQEYRVARGQRPSNRSELWVPSEWPPGHGAGDG